MTAPLHLNDPKAELNGTLAWSYYGNDLEDKLLVQGFNVSFGIAEDGFYSRSNYTTWYVMDMVVHIYINRVVC